MVKIKKYRMSGFTLNFLSNLLLFRGWEGKFDESMTVDVCFLIIHSPLFFHGFGMVDAF